MKSFFSSLIISLFTLLTLTAPASAQESDFGRVGGTFDNTIQAGLCNIGGASLMNPDIQAIVSSGEASAEMTTVGNCVPAVPGSPTGGALDMMGHQLAGIITTKPVSANTYIAHVVENFGLATPAYAQTQGIGFQALSAILPIWAAFRNFAYFTYIIIFIVVGFMIMFRAKIDPQTVVSIQTALPRLIVTLLLITFSYAIAGLMIDLIYVLIYIAAAILSAEGGIFVSATQVTKIIFNHSVFGLLFPTGTPDTLISNPSDAAGAIVESLFGGGIIGGIGSFITEHLTRLIFAAAALFAAIKLYFSLGISFVKIILSVIFAPLILLLNAFPGSNTFSTWARGLLANVIVFPAIALLFMVAAAIIGPNAESVDNYWQVRDGVGYSGADASGDGWAPPFLMLRGSTTGPSASAIGALIGYFMILLSPQVANMINEFFKGSQFNYASAIGQNLTQGGGLVSALPRRARASAQQHRAYEQQAGITAEALRRTNEP